MWPRRRGRRHRLGAWTQTARARPPGHSPSMSPASGSVGAGTSSAAAAAMRSRRRRSNDAVRHHGAGIWSVRASDDELVAERAPRRAPRRTGGGRRWSAFVALFAWLRWRRRVRRVCRHKVEFGLLARGRDRRDSSRATYNRARQRSITMALPASHRARRRSRRTVLIHAEELLSEAAAERDHSARRSGPLARNASSTGACPCQTRAQAAPRRRKSPFPTALSSAARRHRGAPQITRRWTRGAIFHHVVGAGATAADAIDEAFLKIGDLRSRRPAPTRRWAPVALPKVIDGERERLPQLGDAAARRRARAGGRRRRRRHRRHLVRRRRDGDGRGARASRTASGCKAIQATQKW